MSRTRIIMAAAFACVLVTASAEALAQRPNRSVSRPTLSPYLNMYRYDLGLDPFSNYTRPNPSQNQRIRSAPTSAGNRAVNPQRSPEMTRLRGQNLQQPPAIQIAPTGTGSGFMNFGHFYQTQRSGR